MTVVKPLTPECLASMDLDNPAVYYEETLLIGAPIGVLRQSQLQLPLRVEPGIQR